MNTKNKGFTLIELLIVVAIIGILGAVGYPAYTSSVKKANRADGIDSLLSLAGRMETYYLNNDTYAGATVANATSSDGLYTLSISSATAFSYKLAAAPTFSDPECGTLTLDSQGNKGATGTSPDNCW